MPGVADVITAADIPGDNRTGITVIDRPVLAEDKVRFVGEAVAAVAASNAWEAEQAARAIQIEYEVLPAVFDPEEAIRPGAPILHEDRDEGNLVIEWRINRGKVDAAFRKAAAVAEDVYTTQPIEHAYMEPESGLAYLDEEGRVILYTTTQSPHAFRTEIARVLGCQPEQIRVIQTGVGGGFGGKLEISLQAALAVLALRLGRPVKWTFTMEESYVSTSKRHPMHIRCKAAADSEGRLTALEMDILGNAGPYGGSSLAVMSRTAVHSTGPYDIPNVKTRSRSVYTNLPILGGQMRGFGIPQCAFALEQQLDVLADKLGMDPWEFRRRNVLAAGDTTITGQSLDVSVGMGVALDALRPAYGRMKKRAEEESGRGRRLGVGIGSMWYGIGKTGMANNSEVRIEILSDGRAKIYSDCSDIGQGSDTVLAMICAETLQIPMERVELHPPDTDQCPASGGTSASRQTYVSGEAVRNAAMNARSELFRLAAERLEAPTESLDWEGDRVYVSNLPGRGISLADLNGEGEAVVSGDGICSPDTTPLNRETGAGNPYTTFAFGAQAILVEVDEGTGEIWVREACAAHDVGAAIHHINTKGQIEGGIVMGLGQALMENYIPQETPSLTEYLLPTSLDAPQIHAILVEDPEPTGPFGAKGVGEPAMIPTLAAIANGICQATGIRPKKLPIDPVLSKNPSES
jgi:CO/xanthine dehydrogenase Mo-binding subunit